MYVTQALSDIQPLIVQLLTENNGTTEAGVKSVLFDALRDFCQRSLAVRCDDQETLAANTSELVLPQDGNVEPVKVLKIRYADGSGRWVVPQDTHPYVPVLGDPRRFYQPAPNRVVFDGKPQRDIPMTLITAVKPVTLAAQIPEALYNEHFEAVLAGARGRLWTQKNRPYSSAQEGNMQLRRAINLASEARVRAEAGNTTGQPAWRYPFWA